MIHSYFYPRSPCGERLAEVDGEDTSSGDFYPRSPCGERPTITGIIYSDRKISIHALLAESDRATSFAVSVAENFYPRSPCGERPEADGIVDVIGEFLSTLSLRRATQIKQTCRAEIRFLSTLSLRRATDASKDTIKTVTNFYPRSPCGERRHCIPFPRDAGHFYPRSPCGERPPHQQADQHSAGISIHALLAESDAWGRDGIPVYAISIHALLAESDSYPR